MRLAVRIASLVALVVCRLPAAALPLDVVFRTGKAATDGAVLTTIDNAIARSASDIAFSSASSALVTRTARGLSVIVKSGDPAPPPLTGTFGDIGGPAINAAGMIVFSAGVTSLAGGSALFGVTDGVVGTLNASIGGPCSVNAAGDVVHRAGRTLYLWDHGTRTSTPIVTLERRNDARFGASNPRFNGVPILSDSGLVVFLVRDAHGGGVFAWTPADGIVPVAPAGASSPVGGLPYVSHGFLQSIAANGAGQIAFTSELGGHLLPTWGAFLYDLGSRTTTTVAPSGVDRAYVGVDDSGAVAFLGGSAGGAQFVLARDGNLAALTGPIAPAPTDIGRGFGSSHRIVWSSGRDVEGFDGSSVFTLIAVDDVPLGTRFDLGNPAVNDAGTVVAVAERYALHRLHEGRARPIVAGGETVPGAGRVFDFEYAYRGRRLVVAAEGDTGTLIAVDERRGLQKIAASGDPSPAGDLFFGEQLTDIVDFVGHSVVFAARTQSDDVGAIFVRRSASAAIRLILGSQALGGIALVGLGGLHPVFLAATADGRTGVFQARKGNADPIAVPGQSAPGGGTFDDVRAAVAGRHRLLFTAYIDEGTTTARVLFGWDRHDGVVRIAATDTPIDGLGVGEVVPLAPGLGPLALVGTIGRELLGAIFTTRRGELSLLIEEGDRLPDGSTLAHIIAPSVVAIPGGVVFGGVTTDGTTSRGVTFALRRRALHVIASDGDVTSDGRRIVSPTPIPSPGDLVLSASLEDGNQALLTR